MALEVMMNIAQSINWLFMSDHNKAMRDYLLDEIYISVMEEIEWKIKR